ncbi:MAG: hypothetical protein ACI87W_002029 [Halieaceae bacterium]|jgi:uncharacterized protein YeaC (DUF1315 family)
MNYHDLVDRLSPDMLARLRKGIETGRWPDGRELTPEQREHSLQAVIAWEEQHLAPAQRVGFIDKGRKGGRAAPGAADDQPEPLRWQDRDRGGLL